MRLGGWGKKKTQPNNAFNLAGQILIPEWHKVCMRYTVWSLELHSGFNSKSKMRTTVNTYETLLSCQITHCFLIYLLFVSICICILFGEWAMLGCDCWEGDGNGCGEDPKTLLLSPVVSLARAAKASGKFGGVAGVLAGVQSWGWKKITIKQKLKSKNKQWAQSSSQIHQQIKPGPWKIRQKNLWAWCSGPRSPLMSLPSDYKFSNPQNCYKKKW